MTKSDSIKNTIIREGFLLLILASLIMASVYIKDSNLSIALYVVGILGYPSCLFIRFAMWAMRCRE